MANWMTGSDISARYIAGEQKLLDYAQRGNMPMLRRDDGSVVFDEAHAAILFRRRGPSSVLAAPADGEPSFGVLGVSRLGERAAPRAPETEDVAEAPASDTWSRLRSGTLAALREASMRRAG